LFLVSIGRRPFLRFLSYCLISLLVSVACLLICGSFKDDCRLRNTVSFRTVGWSVNDELLTVRQEATVACCGNTFPASIALFASNLRIPILT